MGSDTENSGQGCESGELTPLIISESEHPVLESQIDREALKVLYRLRDAGFKGYLVGGGVRDLYLGRKPKDFDISTDARPGQLRKLFRNSRTIGRRFRLVQVFYRGNKTIEVSTLRSQCEHEIDGPDQVLPSNNTFGTLEEDAFRRDLTINALFYEIEQHTIIDYVGGVADLNQGVVRMVGEPGRRFTRDPVRMMRAVRHAARTGFSLDSATLEAVKEHADKLLLCPSSRLHDEICKDLHSGAAANWAELCLQTPLWVTLFPMYASLLTNGQIKQEIEKEITGTLQVIDRLHAASCEDCQVVIPEQMIFAIFLLPWALRRFSLLNVQLKGRMYQRLFHEIRAELDNSITKQLSIKRAVKDGIASLLVNLPTFHRISKEGNAPKWLKRKSYYRHCSLFYRIYEEFQGKDLVPPDAFVCAKKVKASNRPPVKEKAPEQESSANGRRGFNPAFSSKRLGVFGLRQQDQKH